MATGKKCSNCLDGNLLKEAVRGARMNWEWWEDDYCHQGKFCEMPVFSNYPRFRGFGADYSVFRRLNAIDVERMRKWFRNIDDNPKNFTELYEEFMKYKSECEYLNDETKNGKEIERISLVSKLLAMWKPSEFAMWDQYAKNGLKKLHGNIRRHCYSQNNPETYETFNRGFHILLKQEKDSLIDAAGEWTSCCKGMCSEDVEEAIAARILDNYLMQVGKQKDTNGNQKYYCQRFSQSIENNPDATSV